MLGQTGAFAQVEEDVTHYIVNAGFDEDLTFNADGSTKEIVDGQQRLTSLTLSPSASLIAVRSSLFSSAFCSISFFSSSVSSEKSASETETNFLQTADLK